MWIIGSIAFVTAMFWGHGNLPVALFGIRILMLHFPLIFVIGRVFDQEDVVKIGKVLLFAALPMTALMVIQFNSPQSDFVNLGVGGDTEGAGFVGALGYFRPSGTFSFTTGLTSFYGLVTAYLLYFWIENTETVKKWLVISATFCFIIAIPISISRTLLFQTLISLAFLLVIAIRKPNKLIKIIAALFVGTGLLFLLNNVDFFRTGIEVFIDRFESANEAEGGASGVFVDRFLGGMIGAVTNLNDLPFWGHGVGMGTNVGAKLLTGQTDFLISEQEWGRLIGEMGILLGLAAIGLRAALTVKMAIQSFRALRRENYLPWMLLSFGFLFILQGQWAQPTALGFAVLSGGLILAAFKNKDRTVKNNSQSAIITLKSRRQKSLARA